MISVKFSYFLQKNCSFLIQLMFLSLIVFIFNSCTNKEEPAAKYYEGKIEDNVFFITHSDSVNIIIDQTGSKANTAGKIPWSVNISPDLTDSIKLKLFVSFGGYQPEPVIFSSFKQENDSILLWYSVYKNMNKGIAKSRSISAVETSPKLQYIIIDSIVVLKSKQKFIKSLTGYFN